MIRLLFLIAIIVVVALLIRRLFKSGAGAPSEDAPAQPSDATSEAKLVRCVECGAFVPKAEAVAVPNGFRCGAGCAK